MDIYLRNCFQAIVQENQNIIGCPHFQNLVGVPDIV